MLQYRYESESVYPLFFFFCPGIGPLATVRKVTGSVEVAPSLLDRSPVSWQEAADIKPSSSGEPQLANGIGL